MKFPIKLSFILIVTMSIFTSYVHAQKAVTEWAVSMGSYAYDAVTQASIDGDENIYSIGNFRQTVDFDPGPNIHNLTPSYGFNSSFFFQKLDSNGNFIWAKELKHHLNIKHLPNNDFILFGNFYDSMDVDLSSVSQMIYETPRGFFIGKYDSSGNLLWSKSYSGYIQCHSEAISYDSNGNIFIGASFWGTINFNTGNLSDTLLASGSSDAAFIKLNSTGNFQWVKTISGNHITIPQSLDINNSAELVITGYFEGLVDFDPGIGVNSQLSINEDIFLLKLDSAGNFVSKKAYGGPMYERFNSVFMDKNDNLFVAGDFDSSFDFDPGSGVTTLTPYGISDVFIQKFDSSLSMQWATHFGGSRINRVYSLALDSTDNIFLTGSFTDSVDFNPGTNTANFLGGYNFENGYILKLDSAANFLWAKDLGTRNSKSQGRSILTSPNGNLYNAGIMDTIYFPNNNTLSPITGSEDAYILKIKDCTPIIQNKYVYSCGPYTWGGTTYNSSIVVNDTVINLNGCDSIFILNLTVQNNVFTYDTVNACDSYTLSNGISYFQSQQVLYDTLINQFGCDSVVQLNLVINYADSSTTSVVACDSYTWIDGITYTSNTTSPTFILPNTTGCDSTIHLDLTINHSSYFSDTIVTCNSYTWIDGITYYANNYVSQHTISGGASNGCDSVITLHLTILPRGQFIETIDACDSLTWINGVTYYSSNNTAHYTIPNGASNGCDSTIFLNLTIQNQQRIDSIQACNSYTWINGTTYSSSHTGDSMIFQNQFGCDSIVFLNLTMGNTSYATDNIDACASYTWIDGITYTHDTSNIMHTLTNHQGCDSIVSLNLTILPTSETTIAHTECVSYRWIDGITYTSSTKTSVTLTNIFGCDSIVNLDLTIIPVNIDVTVTDSSFTALATNATFQWINCLTFDPVEMGSDSVYYPMQGGTFAVIVSQNNCIDTSDCFIFTPLSINEHINSSSLQVFPNPTEGLIEIKGFKDQTKNVNLTILDATGKKMLNQYLDIAGGSNTIDISNFPTGVYLLEVDENETYQWFTIIKK